MLGAEGFSLLFLVFEPAHRWNQRLLEEVDDPKDLEGDNADDHDNGP